MKNICFKFIPKTSKFRKRSQSISSTPVLNYYLNYRLERMKCKDDLSEIWNLNMKTKKMESWSQGKMESWSQGNYVFVWSINWHTSFQNLQRPWNNTRTIPSFMSGKKCDEISVHTCVTENLLKSVYNEM